MYTKIDEYKDALKSDEQQYDAYIVLEDGTIVDADISGFKIISNLGQKIIGNFVARRIEFNLFNTNLYNITNKEFEAFVGLKVNGEFNYISLGKFIANKPEVKDEKTDECSITAQDYSLKFKVKYEPVITFPCTVSSAIKQICNHLGIVYKTNSFINADYILEEFFIDEEATFFDVIKTLVAAGFANAHIDNSNSLIIRSPKKASDYSFALNEIFELQKQDNKFGPLNAVVASRIVADDGSTTEDVYARNEASITQNGIYEYKIIQNDAIDYDRQTAVDNMLAGILDFQYVPATIEAVYNPATEVGDLLEVPDVKTDTSFLLYAKEITADLSSGLMTIESSEETQTETDYKAATVKDKRKRTEYKINKMEGKITQMSSSIEEIEQELVLTATTEESKAFHLTDSADSNCKSVEIFGESKAETIEAKNMLPSFNENSQPDDTLSFVINNDGSITFNGTETSGYSMLWFGEGELSLDNPIPISAGTYTLSARHTGTLEGESVFAVMFQSYEDYPVLIIGQQESITFTLPNDDYIEMIMVANMPDTVFTDFTIYPQLEPGEQMTEYQAPGTTSRSIFVNIAEVNIQSKNEDGEESITTIPLLHDLCSLENGVRDRISKIASKWYDVQNVGYTESEGLYELLEPIVTEITDEATINALESIKTYKGITDIESNAPIILTYYRDTPFVDEYETKNDADRKYTITTEKFAQQEITNEGITADVSRIDTSLTNDYMTKEEASTQYQQLDNSFNFAINNAITELKENGISKVVTTQVTIDNNGITVGKSDSEFTNTMSNIGTYQYNAGELIAKYDKDGAEIPRLKSDFAIIAGLKSVREDVDGIIHHKTYVLE